MDNQLERIADALEKLCVLLEDKGYTDRPIVIDGLPGCESEPRYGPIKVDPLYKDALEDFKLPEIDWADAPWWAQSCAWDKSGKFY